MFTIQSGKQHGIVSIPEKAATLTKQYEKHSGRTAGKNCGVAEGHLIPTLLGSGAGMDRASGMPAEGDMLVPYQCQGGNVGPAGTLRKGNGNVGGGVPFIAHTLRGEGFDASEDGTGRGTPLVSQALKAKSRIDGESETFVVEGDSAASTPKLPRLRAGAGGHGTAIAFSCKDHGADAGEASPTLRAMGHGASHANAGGQVAVAIDKSEPQMVVRRLTPNECERLQGLPDDHTQIAWRGKPPEQCPDGPRYRAIGNGMAMPVLRWIGERIQLVEDMLNGK